jgi:putative membrane protein
VNRFFAHWLTTALALGATAWILPGVEVASLTALMAALVLGFVNAVIRPILLLRTLPITLVTLGLFYLVINGLAFGLAAWMVPGFGLRSFGWAILGAFMVVSSPGLSEASGVRIRELGATLSDQDGAQSSTRRNRRALPITESELIVIAALAHIGLISIPTTG